MLANTRTSARLFLHWPSICATGQRPATSSVALVPFRQEVSPACAYAHVLHLAQDSRGYAEIADQHKSAPAPSQPADKQGRAHAQLGRDPCSISCREGSQQRSQRLTACLQWHGRQHFGMVPLHLLMQTQLSMAASRPAMSYSTAAAAEPSEGPSPAAAAMLSSSSAAATQQDSSAEALAEHISAVSPGRVQNIPAPPWTPTRELKKRNFLPRRMGHLMQVLEREAAERAAAEKQYPGFKPGDILELKLAVPENKGRPSTIKGLCIARRNRGWRTSFTLLNYIPGGGPVERSFPLFSPTIQSLSVIGSRRARRAKLYYLRKRKPSEYRA